MNKPGFCHFAAFLLLLFFQASFCYSDEFLYDLKYRSDDNKPFCYEEDGVFKGISIDIMKIIWKELEISEQESSSRNTNNLKKLYAQRIDLAGSFEISFYQDIKEYGYNTDDFEFVYILKEMDAYIGFNKNIPDKTIKKVQRALDLNRDKITEITAYYLK